MIPPARFTATVRKVVDIEGAVDHFTRIYGRETGKRKDGTHVVRPGFDSNIAADNCLQPNEFEKYRVIYDTSDAVFPLNVEYRAYFLKKGGNGKFPTGPDGFLSPTAPSKLAITEIYRQQEVIE